MKMILVILGTVSLVLGVAGIFVPLLPTTPFLLLSAAAYFKGSVRLYNRLLNQKYLGQYIRNFRENRAIPLRAKIYAVALLLGTIGYCIIFLSLPVYVRVILGIIAAGVTWHILSFKTLRR
ncbi:MAG: YbaN family protein [Tannerella sp.]|jgi:uncharacterized membrane protein YbaN (DUF454 family)|nr:YbaN family protein [Tannerella sp.]